MDIRPGSPTGPETPRSAAPAGGLLARRAAALACLLMAGCLGTGAPMLSAGDPSLRPPLATLHTVATSASGRDSVPARLIEARNLMAALVWAQVNDTLYHQAVRANREWPLRLDAPLLSTPPTEALLNVAGDGRSRFGMSLLFLFEDVNGNGRYDRPGRDPGGKQAPGGDGLLGMAGSARIVFISDAAALAWVLAHPPADEILTVLDPASLRVGFNLLDGRNVRDTVFHEYRILYPGGGSSLSQTPPDTGAFETLDYPRKICDGFAPVDWSREIPLEYAPEVDALTNLVTVPRPRSDSR